LGVGRGGRAPNVGQNFAVKDKNTQCTFTLDKIRKVYSKICFFHLCSKISTVLFSLLINLFFFQLFGRSLTEKCFGTNRIYLKKTTTFFQLSRSLQVIPNTKEILLQFKHQLFKSIGLIFDEGIELHHL